MNRTGTYLGSFTNIARAVLVGLAVIFVSAGLAQATAVTTIGTSITTTGAISTTGSGTLSIAGLASLLAGATTTSLTLGSSDILSNPTASSTVLTGRFTSGLLTVSGAATLSSTLGVTGLATFLGGASTTQFTLLAGDTIKNESASSTVLSGRLTSNLLTVSGAATLSSTVGVTGLASFVNASTTGPVSVANNFMVNGMATTTSAGATSMQSTLTVGASGNAVNNIIAGYCVTTVAFAVASTTGVYANCTPYTPAGVAITNLTAGTGSGASRPFVMATSSLPAWIHIQSASTTAASTINVELSNVSPTTIVGSATYAFNFWSFQ